MQRLMSNERRRPKTMKDKNFGSCRQAPFVCNLTPVPRKGVFPRAPFFTKHWRLLLKRPFFRSHGKTRDDCTSLVTFSEGVSFLVKKGPFIPSMSVMLGQRNNWCPPWAKVRARAHSVLACPTPKTVRAKTPEAFQRRPVSGVGVPLGKRHFQGNDLLLLPTVRKLQF